MLITRRTFLGRTALAAAGSCAPSLLAQAMPQAHAEIPNLLPDTLAKFVDPLPLPRIAKPVDLRTIPNNPISNGGPHGGNERVPFYRVSMSAVSQKLHRDLPPTPLWAYGGAVPGVQIEARSGEGLLVEWANDLPRKHLLPIDHSLHGAEKEQPEVRGVVHLHGGRTPAGSDGYPEDWYVPGQSRTYYYPNRQDAAALFYHDHAMGINRLNVYAGLVGLYVVRDAVEDALHLPGGPHEIPLVLMDRDLKPDGRLSYPVSPHPEMPWVPEAFGEAHLVNGKLFPYLDVEPRKYRFRILNAANGRFYRLALSGGLEMRQIGTDQGLLAAPVTMKTVHLAPGERADVVVDFSAARGAQIVLESAPFELLQFRVSAAPAADESMVPSALRAVPRFAESAAAATRRLTLDENLNPVSESMGMLLNKTPWHSPITEKPKLGTTEIWELVNLTDDTHPIHLHMVQFQVLDRRSFDWFGYMTTEKLRYTRPAMPPEANELGWKDTVRANSHTVTRIIVPFTGYAGRYVWHCHILEHEDNEMMRPYEVLPA